MKDDEQIGFVAGVIRIAQVLTPIFLAFLIPWGGWMTQKVIAFEEWKNIAPRFTQSDAQALELRAKTSAADIADARISQVERKIDALQTSMIKVELMIEKHMAATTPTK